MESLATKFIQKTTILLSFLSLTVIFWAQDKGFNFTDEAYYILSYFYPANTLSGTSFYQHFFAFIVNKLSLNIYDLRLVKFITIIAISLLLTKSVLAFIEAQSKIVLNKTEKFVTASLIILGASTNYSYSPFSPAYNDLTDWVLLLCLSLLFFTQSNMTKTNPIKSYICYLSLGLIIAFQLFTKSPVALLLVLSVALWILIFEQRQKVYKLLSLVIGLAAGVLLLSSWLTQINGITPWESFLHSYGKVTSQHHHPIHLLYAYLKNSFHTLKQLFLFIPLLMLPLLKYIPALNQSATPKLKKYFTYLICILSLGLFTYNGLHLPNPQNPYPAIGYLIILILLITQTTHILEKYWALNRLQWFSLFLFLFSIPFIGSAGTGNYLWQHISFHQSSWIVLLGLLLMSLKRSKENLRTYQILLLCTTLLLSFRISFGTLYNSYRQSGNILANTIFVSEPYNLLLTSQDAHVIEQARTIKTQLNLLPNQPTMVFHDNPGITLALNGYSIGEQWYFQDAPQRTCLAISTITDSDLSRLLILTDTPLSEPISTCLGNAGINLASDFEIQGVIYNVPPYNKDFTVWARKSL